MATGENTLTPTEIGQDVAGIDLDMRVYAEQLEVSDLGNSQIGVTATYQPISIIANIYLYDSTTGALKYTLLRQTISGYNKLILDQGDLGDICWVQYRF